MTTDEWLHPRGTLGRDGWETVVDGSLPDWEHTGLRVAVLAEGDALELAASGVERMVVPLAGSFAVRHREADGDERVTDLEGRASVFAGPTDVLYLSCDASAVLTGSGRVAVAESPATRPVPSHRIAREDVPVELRGAGRSSRQVHNFGTPGTPGSLDAERLIVCEVLTPAENWSSYPAHKHDEDKPGRSRGWRRSTTSRPPSAAGWTRPRTRIPSACSTPRPRPRARSRSTPSCARATSRSCPTATTGPPSRRPATTSTTST